MVKRNFIPVVAAALALAACSRSDQQQAQRDLDHTGAKVKEELRKDAAFVKEETKKDAAFVRQQALQARDETKKGVDEIRKNVKAKVREHREAQDRP